MKKNLFGVLFSAAVIPVLLTGCAFQNVGTFDDSTNNSTSSSEDSQSFSPSIGDQIQAEEFNIILNSARFSKTDIFGTPPENDSYLILDLTIENKSAEENSISSLLNFTLQGSDSYEYSQSLTAKKKGNLDGSILAGSKLRGEIAYDVPKLDFYDFSYKNTLFSDSVSFHIQSSQIK